MSYAFDAEDITYTVEVAKDYLFEDVIYPQAWSGDPGGGDWSCRRQGSISSGCGQTNATGKTQDAFDYYVTDEGKQYGMRCIYVTEDGQIEEDIYEE